MASPASFSGAPTTSVREPKLTALHLRSEEKGTDAAGLNRPLAVKRPRRAVKVALLSADPEARS